LYTCNSKNESICSERAAPNTLLEERLADLVHAQTVGFVNDSALKNVSLHHFQKWWLLLVLGDLEMAVSATKPPSLSLAEVVKVRVIR
jgi:hypothetical protein